MRRTQNRGWWWVWGLIVTVAGAMGSRADDSPPDPTRYRSPGQLAISARAGRLAVADQTRRSVVLVDADKWKIAARVPLAGRPTAVVWDPAGSVLYAAEHGAGTVAVIDGAKGEVRSRIRVGKWPAALAAAPARTPRRLYVGNQDRHTVSVVQWDANGPQVVKEIPVSREPSDMEVTPDGRYVVVANLLPHGSGLDPDLSAEVSIVDTQTLSVAHAVKLPPGSTLVRGVCVGPKGRWAYVVHGLGRFTSPITQLERGWVNTYALSIIDVAEGHRRATVLLDELTRGAADPHSIVVSPDGRYVWISHTGVHEVSRVDVGLLHELFEGNVPKWLVDLKDGMRDNIWVEIQRDRSKISVLQDDLTALFIARAIERWPSGGTGPKGLALSADGTRLWVANYFSGGVSLLQTETGRVDTTLSLGAQPEPDAVRRGERIFHDATYAFQRWHSCASCHANEGRVDGLRWDFLADGIGNAKDTVSLVWLHHTEPMNRRATVATAKECARGGLQSTNGLVPTEQDVEDLYAYLTSLRPMPSPHLDENGRRTAAAVRGKAIFEGRAGCAQCHPAPYFTDRKMHNVGVLSPNEPDGRYDTPSLIEAYRTGPYLHDGRAVTLREVLVEHNEKGLHGKVKGLSEQQLKDLIEYVKSL